MSSKLFFYYAVLIIKLQCLAFVFGAVFESSINVCENVADYIFIQNIEDCSKYFLCIDGQAITQQCRPGLYFDASRQACIASRSGCLQCPKQSRRNIPLLKTCDKYVSCYFGNVYLRKCDNQQQFNRITGKCDLAKNVDCVDNRCSIHALDKNVTYVTSAAKCDSYYVCLGGQARALTCAQGLYFSTKCNCCDLSSNVDCAIEEEETFTTKTKEKRISATGLVEKLHLPTVLNANVNIKCPKTGSFIYPYNGNPEYYYTCLNGVAALKACAEGYQFNNTYKRCIRQQPEEENFSTNFEANVAVEEINLLDATCPEFGPAIMPHSESKEKYILCMNGQPALFECAKGLVYNDKLKKCFTENSLDDFAIYQPALTTEAHNIVCPRFGTFKYPHPNNTHYYLCTDGKVYVLACDSNEIFDAEVNICRQMANVDDVNENVEGEPKVTRQAESASNIICPKVGIFMLPHNQRNRYYLCMHGHAMDLACATGYIYDAEISACKPDNERVTNNIGTPALLDEPVNVLCPLAGASKFPHVEKNKFYLCINGMGSVLACPNDTSFDVETLDCRKHLEEIQEYSEESNDSIGLTAEHTIKCPKLGTFVYAHENDTRYIVCLDGKSIVLACNEGLYFDAKEKVCRAPEKNNVENIKALVNVKENTTHVLNISKVDGEFETNEQVNVESSETLNQEEINADNNKEIEESLESFNQASNEDN